MLDAGKVRRLAKETRLAEARAKQSKAARMARVKAKQELKARMAAKRVELAAQDAQAAQDAEDGEADSADQEDYAVEGGKSHRGVKATPSKKRAKTEEPSLLARLLEEMQSMKKQLAEVQAGQGASTANKPEGATRGRHASPDTSVTGNALMSALRGTSPKAGARVSIQDPDTFIMLTRMGIQWSRTEMEFRGMPVFSTDQETNLPLFSNTAQNKNSRLCKYAVNMINAANSGTAAGTKQLHGVPENLLPDLRPAPSPAARSGSRQAASPKPSSKGRKSASEGSSCDGPWGAAL
jgi:hypothetical protein